MGMKSIKSITRAERVNMGGQQLDQPLPSDHISYFDPFLLIHHWKDVLAGEQRQQDVGVGPHPHRGFSPVTFIYKGEIRHQDSFGNDVIVGEGGTQWMFAGRGITHSERPSKKMAEEGGELELIQFWVNAPAKHKMETASYKPISKEITPTIEKEAYTIQVISGEYEGIRGSVDYYIPLQLLRIEINAKGSLSMLTQKTHNTLIYLLDGELLINGIKAYKKNMFCFEQDGDSIEIEAIKDTRFILLSGEPINEEVYMRGPFVMNSDTELLEASRDTQIGKMGILIEKFD